MFSNGYTLTANADGSTDAMDTKGAVVLHVPQGAGAVTMAAGHALVVSSTGERRVAISFALHDLTRGGATAASFTAPGTPGVAQRGVLVGGSHARPIVAWLGDSSGTISVPTMAAVVDTAAGRPAAPVQLPGFQFVDDVTAAVDETTGNALIYHRKAVASSLLVGLDDGRVRWSQKGTGPLLPQALRAGTIYGILFDANHSSAKAVSVTESTGEIAAQDYELFPMAFTSSGSTIFAERGTGQDGVVVSAAAPAHT
jgi:hypothetical protein